MNNLSWKCLAVLALSLLVAGCGDGGPRLYKAGGTVTYKSAPVADATVTFAYEDGNFANAVTDANGKYSLAYMGKPGGAPLGKCKVGVTKNANIKVDTAAAATPAVPPKSEADFKKQNDDKVKAMMKFTADKAAETAAGGPQSLIPKKYADANTSGLSFEIKSDEKLNDFPIDLKD